jgi:hypothetical protein
MIEAFLSLITHLPAPYHVRFGAYRRQGFEKMIPEISGFFQNSYPSLTILPSIYYLLA